MDFSAAPSLLGYLYQCRYALLDSLRRLPQGQEFVVSIETLDDVVFEERGEAPELLQTKHHLKRTADLTDGSSDLWKTIRIWCEGRTNATIPLDTTFFLITTAHAAEGSAAYYLRAGESRNVERAIERLNSTADSSRNQTNFASYTSYRALEIDQKIGLFNNVFIVDGAPAIDDLDSSLKQEIFFVAESKFLDSYLQRLEGWWFWRVVKHLTGSSPTPILREEIDAEIARLREQFKQDNLPIDDDIMVASVDASGYQDRIFVHQLKIIEIGNPRIFFAIRNYFRAFTQRSRWIREDLLLVG
jgi:hypothetical protein